MKATVKFKNEALINTPCDRLEIKDAYIKGAYMLLVWLGGEVILRAPMEGIQSVQTTDGGEEAV